MINLTKYYKIGPNGTKWIPCQFDRTKTQINLYDKFEGKMIFLGVGLY